MGFCSFILCGGFCQCPDGPGPCEGHTRALKMYDTSPPTGGYGVGRRIRESEQSSKPTKGAAASPARAPWTEEVTHGGGRRSPDLSGEQCARRCHRLGGLRQHGSGDQKSETEGSAQLLSLQGPWRNLTALSQLPVAPGILGLWVNRCHLPPVPLLPSLCLL